MTKKEPPIKFIEKPEFLTGLVIGAVAAAIVGGLLFFLIFPLALKHRTSFPLEDAIGTNRVLAAVPAEYKRMENPLPSDSQTAAAGKTVFLSNCAVCHGADGKGDTPIGRNLYPPAADLAGERVIQMNDGEVAWIIKFGLSFVGMPSFKSELSDQEVWQTVVFIRSLEPGGPKLPSGGSQTGGGAATQGGQPSSGGGGTATQGGASGGQPAAAGAGSSPSAAELAKGKQLFAQKGCSSCHGDNAGGGVGPKLSGTSLPLKVVLTTVRNGRGAMPAFDKSSVTDSEVKTIYQWLESGP
jgi:mono/diheme cytochrome c family protein